MQYFEDLYYMIIEWLLDTSSQKAGVNLTATMVWVFVMEWNVYHVSLFTTIFFVRWFFCVVAAFQLISR